MFRCSKDAVDTGDLGNQRGIGNGKADVEAESADVAGDHGGFTE